MTLTDPGPATAAPTAPGALLAPGVPADWPWPPACGDELVTVAGAFDEEWETAAHCRAVAEGRPWLSVRITAAEILVGPLWTPTAAVGCSGCAETRALAAVSDPLFFVTDRTLRTPASARGGNGAPPLLRTLLAAYGELLRTEPLAPGELLALSTDRGVRRHRVHRSIDCTVCGDPAPTPQDAETLPPVPPEPVALCSRPSSAAVPTRGDDGPDLRREAMRENLVDHRFGPVTQMFRDDNAPFAMTGAVLGGARFPGFGRGCSFDATEPVAVLEAYERFGGYPHQASLVRGRSHRELGDLALDPDRLGRYTERQLASPISRVLARTADTPMDWAWGHRLAGGEPLLVPADVAFYQYGYPEPGGRPDMAFQRARRPDSGGRASTRANYFLESSSGCALGGSREEAALHSLFELAERDAILMAWHAQQPLAHLDHAEVRADPEARHLMDLIEAADYDIHLLVTTSDLALPSVWALAVHRRRALPASFTAAGAGPDPMTAVRAGLWEISQLVGHGLNWDPDDVAPMLDDPWKVDMLVDHHRLYGFPETLPRVEKVLGGPRLTLAEAFPGWPGVFAEAAAGDVRGALEFMAGHFAAAGLDEIVIVDQTTREHADLGLASVKAVVPGIVAMSFGHAQQRLAGLPRFATRTAGAGVPCDEELLPLDPHPFP
ncbi:hypothetical protein BLA24_06550 [Streptomyces cinnamoneus]|uniref:YcaO domain-containing protein n=1 Tax=Streptomyces cinnamoneus TaxID=53446 RepID=A0A2G1XMK8_STRCJ|nr:TOMM precursor leader peptide-binding protein [Streptomyces cinnamoneus]PHQ52440.1 hypothetical protein BLA24_06550 [Streptomyces cinnamoneus]PPT15972.1 hypothetical protein CYQ11_26700 [Streptomyces cinnamoneus]